VVFGSFDGFFLINISRCFSFRRFFPNVLFFAPDESLFFLLSRSPPSPNYLPFSPPTILGGEILSTVPKRPALNLRSHSPCFLYFFWSSAKSPSFSFPSPFSFRKACTSFVFSFFPFFPPSPCVRMSTGTPNSLFPNPPSTQ